MNIIFTLLQRFISNSQLRIIVTGISHGEERQFFADKAHEIEKRLTTMPKTYEQDGKGDDAIVYLHYFQGNMDWYITERDIEAEQLQAFGLADLGTGYPELGYINIQELIDNGVELDLYWEPKTIREVKA